MFRRKKDRTIFHVIVIPMISIFIIFILLIIGMLNMGGVFSKLDENAQGMFSQQLENRSNFLTNDMLTNWTHVEDTVEEINSIVELKLSNGEIALSDFDDLNKCELLLNEIDDKIINLMYSNRVTGAFVIINTHSLNDINITDQVPGIYFRDIDPTVVSSKYKDDILTQRAPESVVVSGAFNKDTDWQPYFSYEDSIGREFFSKPFMAAYSDTNSPDSSEYGYWTTEPYSLSGDDKTALAFSVPLILEDGTVYGVMGIELLTDYIQTLLPYSELLDDDKGSYLLTVATEDSDELNPVVLSSKYLDTDDLISNNDLNLKYDVNQEVLRESELYFLDIRNLDVYSDEGPYGLEDWYLVAIADKETMFVFSQQIRMILFNATLLALVMGFVTLFIVSYRFSKPIVKLSKEVKDAEMEKVMPVLSDTGIREIDQFSSSITKLGSEVIKSSTRLLNIINMASVDIGGYEILGDSDEIYVTKNFFPMLGMSDVDVTNLTKQEFLNKLEWIRSNMQHLVSERGDYIYAVPQGEGGLRYYRSEQKRHGKGYIGLLEDVTASVVEKNRIEHERDCDGLTGLYNGQGFRRKAKEILEDSYRAKCSAFLMMDLDNLKNLNDSYGHGFGDKYIKSTAKCFEDNVPTGDLCGRISGDEFCILFHGYDNKDDILEKIEYLYECMKNVTFNTPNGEIKRLSVSGGVVFYPEDSTDLTTLMKYADFAMYKSKTSSKGSYSEFNHEAFMEKSRQNQMRVDFNHLLEKRKVNYHFQPIFNAWDGSVYAYEALMRVGIPSLRSPLTVIDLAREADKLNDIEEITMFCSTECFKKLRENNKIYPGTKMFVNSIANACMSEANASRYNEIYGHLQEDIVVEITESEHLNLEYLEKKRKAKGFNGRFALDDYGSGYNNEINLLELNPHYVKLDISIVRDIDKSEDKRQIVTNVIDYAHERNMLVVAEGIETAEELKTCMKLGSDLLQGYFLARPNEIPDDISEEALKVIEMFRAENPI